MTASANRTLSTQRNSRACLAVSAAVRGALLAAVSVTALLLACGSDTDGTSSSEGGAGGTTGRGGSAVSGIGANLQNCVGCAEFVTTSEKDPELCDVGSLDLYVALQNCLCGQCEAICGRGCRLPGPDCSACRLTASHEACKAEADACATDL